MNHFTRSDGLRPNPISLPIRSPHLAASAIKQDAGNHGTGSLLTRKPNQREGFKIPSSSIKSSETSFMCKCCPGQPKSFATEEERTAHMELKEPNTRRQKHRGVDRKKKKHRHEFGNQSDNGVVVPGVPKEWLDGTSDISYARTHAQLLACDQMLSHIEKRFIRPPSPYAPVPVTIEGEYHGEGDNIEDTGLRSVLPHTPKKGFQITMAGITMHHTISKDRTACEEDRKAALFREMGMRMTQHTLKLPSSSIIIAPEVAGSAQGPGRENAQDEPNETVDSEFELLQTKKELEFLRLQGEVRSLEVELQNYVPRPSDFPSRRWNEGAVITYYDQGLSIFRRSLIVHNKLEKMVRESVQ